MAFDGLGAFVGDHIASKVTRQTGPLPRPPAQVYFLYTSAVRSCYVAEIKSCDFMPLPHKMACWTAPGNWISGFFGMTLGKSQFPNCHALPPTVIDWSLKHKIIEMGWGPARNFFLPGGDGA